MNRCNKTWIANGRGIIRECEKIAHNTELRQSIKIGSWTLSVELNGSLSVF